MRVPCLKVSPIGTENKREMRHTRHKSPAIDMLNDALRSVCAEFDFC
jgi:hypothetical protein